MKGKIIIDSSTLVALFDESDLWHNATIELLTECERQDISVIILDAVIDETVSVLVRRFHDKKKSNNLAECFEKINSFISNGKLRFTSSIIRKHFRTILDLILKSNNTLSFTDALIVHFLHQNNLKNLLSFDSDFDSISGISRIFSVEQLKSSHS